jgi:hypothetical protein
MWPAAVGRVASALDKMLEGEPLAEPADPPEFAEIPEPAFSSEAA